LAAKRLGFNKDALNGRFFLPDTPFKPVNNFQRGARIHMLPTLNSVEKMPEPETESQ
jgi:hypothetical protein